MKGKKDDELDTKINCALIMHRVVVFFAVSGVVLLNPRCTAAYGSCVGTSEPGVRLFPATTNMESALKPWRWENEALSGPFLLLVFLRMECQSIALSEHLSAWTTLEYICNNLEELVDFWGLATANDICEYSVSIAS